MKLHITSMFWMLDRKAAPFLKGTDEDGKDIYIRLKRNSFISVEKEYGRFCTGFFRDGKHIPCPNKRRIEYGTRCDECKGKDEYLACAKCNGLACNASDTMRRNCLNQTYFLYITLIGEVIKVGITKSSRYLRRWIEQGSDYSCIIDSGNGMEMRQKEFELSKSIADRVRTKRKIEMINKCDLEKLERFLKERNLNVPIVNVRKYYDGIDSMPESINASDKLDGRIVCVKGKVIIYEKNNEYFAYDINNMLAKIVDIRT